MKWRNYAVLGVGGICHGGAGEPGEAMQTVQLRALWGFSGL